VKLLIKYKVDVNVADNVSEIGMLFWSSQPFSGTYDDLCLKYYSRRMDGLCCI
jgi:hypothetical protein